MGTEERSGWKENGVVEIRELNLRARPNPLGHAVGEFINVKAHDMRNVSLRTTFNHKISVSEADKNTKTDSCVR